MPIYRARALSLAISLSCAAGAAHAADPGVELVGRALISGIALDKSGLNGQMICRKDTNECIDQATFGGWGSGLTYTGSDNVFLAVPDRGPFDGRTDVAYLDRVHFVYIAVDTSKPVDQALRVELLDTRFLTDKKNAFVGDLSKFDYRLDPEAIVATSNKGFYVSDEYGPYIYKFGLDGKLEQRVTVPAWFSIPNPSDKAYDDGSSCELDDDVNDSGRQANRGMEGLAITPDGKTLVGLMQNALVQDYGLNPDADTLRCDQMADPPAAPPSRRGFNSRLLKIDPKTGASAEYVYSVDATGSGRGQNDILAINDHEFLVLERDNRTRIPTPPNAAQGPQEKRLYRIDLNEEGLTDVSGIFNLPITKDELDDDPNRTIKGVTKHLFLNLLDQDYKINGTAISELIAEKVEALAWGPDLPDGRHLLLIATDNDLFAGDATHPEGLPTQVYAFAIDAAAAGITYVPQSMQGPFFPPGQVKKIVGQ